MPEMEKLEKVTVRFTPTAWEAIKTTAEENGMSAAELVRASVAGNIADYLGTVKFADERQGEEVKELVKSMISAQADLKLELNRIGVNFNQEVKLRNMAKKNNMSFREGWNKALSEDTSLDLDRLENIINTFYEAMRKAGDELCRILV